MRTELRLYSTEHPRAPWRAHISDLWSTIRLAIFERSLRRCELGSPAWHRLQEKMSHLSSVGLDAQLRNVFYMRTLRMCGPGLFVHPNVSFYYPSNINIGSNVFINRGVFVMAPVPVSLGNNTLIGPYVVLNSGSHLYASRSTPITDQDHKYGPILVEDDVWIGAHVCVLPGVTLATGAVVAAGAVVTKSVDPYTVVGGIPAKPIATRHSP